MLLLEVNILPSPVQTHLALCIAQHAAYLLMWILKHALTMEGLTLSGTIS